MTDWIEISPCLEKGVAVWPGDCDFRRKVSFDMHDGHNYSLSSIETTVHVGAHTDAPNHFVKNGVGIDRVEVGKYIGSCQVVQVARRPNGLIRPDDLRGAEITEPRVLFKTSSFPDPLRFSEDFMALSPEIVRFLAGRSVVLVGIDTASIDPFASKSLPAHLATAETGMAILEGIVLDAVKPGRYELIAVPLRIKDGDASPVRALLRMR